MGFVEERHPDASDTLQMTKPTLSNLPVELLDAILSWVRRERQESDYQLDLKGTPLSPLHPILFLNKRLASRAVERLYQHPAPFPLNKWKSENLLKTLLSSIRGTALFPYHVHVQKLSIGDWRYIDATQVIQQDYIKVELQELLNGILTLGRLRHLGMTFTLDNNHPEIIRAEADLTLLTSLKVCCEGKFYDRAQAWLKDLKTRTNIEALEIEMKSCPNPWEIFVLPTYTLKVLKAQGRCDFMKADSRYGKTRFTESILSQQCESLTFIDLKSVSVSLASPLSFPNLQYLSLNFCDVEGWDILCESLVSLKHLKLFYASLEEYCYQGYSLEFPGPCPSLSSNP